MSKHTIPHATSEDTSGHMDDWAYVEQQDLFTYITNMSVPSSDTHITYTLINGEQVRVPQAAILAPENIQRYRDDAGVGSAVVRAEFRILANGISKMNDRARLLDMQYETDFMSDVIDWLKEAEGLIEYVLNPSSFDLLFDERLHLVWPLPKEVVR